MRLMRLLLMPLRRLLLQVILLLAIYFFSRLAFTLINRNHFEGLNAGAFIRIAFFAMRYDLSAICAINALYILLLLLPGPERGRARRERLLQGFFILSNSLAFLFEIADWAYFPYNFKRATADVLKLVSRQGDFWSILPSYALTYWYVPLAAALFILLFIKANNRIRRSTPIGSKPRPAKRWQIMAGQFVLLLLIFGVVIIGIRGGTQYIPIGLRNAVQVADSRYVPIVLNTPFSIITTLTAPSLEEVRYMSDVEAARRMPFRHQYSGRPARKKNVVVIILESCSKEFTALGRGISYTPFLDSLMGRSLVCTQAFANGQTSAEGIPAIIAGIPTLMEEAFTTSNYGTNRITALPSTLREWGYNSAFFHGGTNGTMSFDIFAAAAGFTHYYGRSEYANERDYDGAWGIRDRPFLQYTAAKLSHMQPPFFASIFTLSAHPPYGLPEADKQSLPRGPLPVQQCIAYADLALREFFATARLNSWYDSTLFIITADHCSPQNGGGYYARGMGRFAIPILFFAPGDSNLRGIIDTAVQQLDILPSVLQYLGYDKPFFAFGNSIFSREEPRFVVTYSSDNYQWQQGPWLLQSAGVAAKSLYRFPQDSLCRNNLITAQAHAGKMLLEELKAFIQQYNSALLHNAMQ